MKPARRCLFPILLFLLCLIAGAPGPGMAQPDGCKVHLLTGEEYFYALKDAIDGARNSITIAIYLFKTNRFKTNRATAIQNALLRAMRRGVDVTVIFERSDNREDFINGENEKTGRRLQAAGAHVFWDRPDRKLHVKAVVIDQQLVFMGSHNLTHSALKYNQEMSLMLHSERIAGKIIDRLNRFPRTRFKEQE
jgi:phosphatidylserine/phosphatidylglycerophosphate/cardiolipin synthase-like enzyme